jgi:hypothetical protein
MSKENDTPSLAATALAATAAAEAATRKPVLRSVTLQEPIQRGEQTITRVDVRKPRAGELMGVQLAMLVAMDVGALTTVLPRVTLPTLLPQDVANLDPADLLALGMEVSGFFVTQAELASLPA